jgi:hypothetical protein
MYSGIFYRVVVVRTDVSENISLPSSEFFTVTGFLTVDQPLHTGILCMVDEHSLLGCFHGAISYRCFLGLCTDVSESVSFPFSGFLRVTGPHSCVTVESLLISLCTEGYYVCKI